MLGHFIASQRCPNKVTAVVACWGVDRCRFKVFWDIWDIVLRPGGVPIWFDIGIFQKSLISWCVASWCPSFELHWDVSEVLFCVPNWSHVWCVCSGVVKVLIWVSKFGWDAVYLCPEMVLKWMEIWCIYGIWDAILEVPYKVSQINLGHSICWCPKVVLKKVVGMQLWYGTVGCYKRGVPYSMSY